MTGKAIRHLLYILLAIVGVVRRGKCEFLERAEHDDYLNEYYLVFDESKHLQLHEVDDTMLEIDLINRNRLTHEAPRVLYQVG
ncbi:giant-lens protein, partial [Lasius niger]